MSDANVSVPFKHPWPEDVIGNVGSVTVGGTPKTAVPTYWNGDVPWMASGDVHLKRITDVPTRITQLGLRFSNATMVDPPAVAIGLAGQGKTRGTVALVLCPLCTNQSVALIKGEPDTLDTTYLLYNLEYRYEELRSRSAGGGRGLSKQLLEVVPVPLPPPTEQSKIAEILSTVDRAIEQTEALIAKQQRIKTGLMQDLLTRGIDEQGNLRSEETHQFKDSPLGRIPVEWDAKKTQEVVRKLWIGLVTTMTTNYVREGVKLIRNQNIKENCIQTEGLINLSPRFANLFRNRMLRLGDVVTVHTGDVGTSAVVNDLFDRSHGFATINTRVASEVVDAKYLCWFFNSGQFKRQIALVVTGDGRDNLNLKDFVHLHVPVPNTLSEQKRISDTLDACESRIANESGYLSKLQKQKTALMQDLLTGEKRVTPLLEPAVTT